ASDFIATVSGTVQITTPLVSGVDSSYLVTFNDIAGNGTLSVKLIDDGTIRDADNNTMTLRASDFATQPAYPVGSDPITLAKADFNNDGKIDLLAGNLN